MEIMFLILALPLSSTCAAGLCCLCRSVYRIPSKVSIISKIQNDAVSLSS